MATTETVSESAKTKVIQTEKLLIRGHLLRYADAAIQIGNISLVSIEHLPLPRLPVWAIITFIIGMFLVFYGSNFYEEEIVTMGTAIGAIGLVSLLIWMGIRESRKEKKYLNIRMNSGDVYCLFLSDSTFMRTVLQLLANIIETGTTPNTYFSIEVSDCDIRDSNGNIVNIMQR